jgi:hypothetical protein
MAYESCQAEGVVLPLAGQAGVGEKGAKHENGLPRAQPSPRAIPSNTPHASRRFGDVWTHATGCLATRAPTIEQCFMWRANQPPLLVARCTVAWQVTATNQTSPYFLPAAPILPRDPHAHAAAGPPQSQIPSSPCSSFPRPPLALPTLAPPAASPSSRCRGLP